MSPNTDRASAEKRAYFLWLAGRVTDLLPKEAGSRNRFAMIVFSEGGKPQFVGRGNRLDAIRALREMADRLERQEAREMANLFPVADAYDQATVVTTQSPVLCIPRPCDPEGWNVFGPEQGEIRK